MVNAWERKQKRERYRDASLEFVIALSAGMKKKNGGNLSIYDFAPDLKPEQTQEESEEQLKMFFIRLSAQSKAKKEKTANG